ncbi:hypothetical protein D9757_000628 [Collybiopsis confluens]|uniref:histone deacetylase n=1 Tax=Collybiopsis confluens TaxID=2823264 RepID=A0A8H5I1W9_9AGAR|nr:hypothetical protein D9757_000628 [Collybiopsis confluens]
MAGRQDDMDVDTNAQHPYAHALKAHPRSNSVPFQPPKDLTVGYVYSAEMTSHFHPQGHQETPERITRIWSAIVLEKYHTKMQWLPIRPVTKAEALLVHSQITWDLIEAYQYMSEQQIADSAAYYEQLSLYVMAGTTRAARLSCGAVIEAGLAVARGRLRKVFAICRPPGHHAEPDQSMGFCFFNNVAVASRVVQQLTPIKRILILDWDVHHGNGTQKAFNDDPSVLYISLHRYEGGTFYPCGEFGGMASCGEGDGLGYSVNIPWPERGMGDADYIHAFQRIVMPIAMEFAPELVIISAGFDAALGDELGECNVSPAGYAHMTHMLSGLAGGRLVVALEGGYNLDATMKSAVAVIKVLLGEAPDPLPPMQASETATETVYMVAKEQSKYWKSIDTKSCEPRDEVESISFSIPEILQAHRFHYLSTTFKMMQVPLLGDLVDPFKGQVLCSQDLFDNKTLVVLAHEFGNLRLELESIMTCDLNLERSYLLDFSKELMRWINAEGYALIDVNLYPKPFTSVQQSYKRMANNKNATRYDEASNLLTYLWDNYMQLSKAQKIIFIGHGPACQPLMDLIDGRFNSIKKSVKGVIQIVGNAKLYDIFRLFDYGDGGSLVPGVLLNKRRHSWALKDKSRLALQMATARPVPPVVIPSSGNNIIVNPLQRGNPVLESIRNVGKEFGDIVADYQSQISSLTPRIHSYTNRKAWSTLYFAGLIDTLRYQHKDSIRELTKVCITNNMTIIVAFSSEEAGHYLSIFKQFEYKPPNMIKERRDKDYYSMLRTSLTGISRVNKTDVETLRSSLGSIANIAKAPPEQLSNLPGFGQVKVKNIKNAFEKPFRNHATSSLAFMASSQESKETDDVIQDGGEDDRRDPSPVWDIELDLNGPEEAANA